MRATRTLLRGFLSSRIQLMFFLFAPLMLVVLLPLLSRIRREATEAQPEAAAA